nr:hypothetical protein CFP56_71026 [Quercus suber]
MKGLGHRHDDPIPKFRAVSKDLIFTLRNLAAYTWRHAGRGRSMIHWSQKDGCAASTDRASAMDATYD